MSLFIARLIRPRAASPTRCQTRFLGQGAGSCAAISPPAASQVTAEEADRRELEGRPAPERWTLKAAASSSRRTIACELTSCPAWTGRRLDREDPQGDDDRLDQGTPASPASY